MTLRGFWRDAQRFAARIVSMLSVPDAPLPRGDERPLVLFSCYDADRGMKDEEGRFSPLLEGIWDVVDRLGYCSVNLTHPFAAWRSAEVKRGTVTINYRALRARLRALLSAPAGRAAARHGEEVAMYRSLLEALRPQVVFSIQPPIAMCEAARLTGVRVVEAMHGNHISPHDRIFREHMSRPDHHLPQVVLSFDDVSHATVSAYCSGRDILPLRVGHPWLRLLQRTASERPARAARGEKTVLLTLQWGYDGERDTLAGIVPNGILHPALEQAIADLEGRGVDLLVRMHPIQLNSPGYRHHRRYVVSLARRFAHVRVDRASTLALPLLLEESCGHITMSSSSAGDAAMAGVPSLLLCPTLRPGGANHGLFRELEPSGLVTFGALDARAIVAWIDACPPRARHVRAPAEGVPEDEELRFYERLIGRGLAGGRSHGAALPHGARTCEETP